MVQLGRVRQHRPEPRSEIGGDRDLPGKRLRHQRAHLLHEVPHLQRPAVAVHSATESQQLLDDIRPALGALLDHPEQFEIVGRRQAVPQQRRHHHHRCENIVQVVRDAARKRADGFEPLRAQKLFLQILPLGDVFGHTHRAKDHAITTQRCGAEGDHHLVAVFLRQADLAIGDGFAAFDGGDKALHQVGLAGLQQLGHLGCTSRGHRHDGVDETTVEPRGEFRVGEMFTSYRITLDEVDEVP